VARFQIYECSDSTCRYRFPAGEGEGQPVECPRCGLPARPAGPPYEGHTVGRPGTSSAGPRLEALLDNIRSSYNVGAIFRTADGAAFQPLHLCGITATPSNPKVAKTALGAEERVAWHYYPNGLEAAVALREQGTLLWALEGGPRSRSLFAGLPERPERPVCLVVGNELAGVDPAILELCERLFHLPMQGEKRSLNVAVAFGVASYFLRYCWGGAAGVARVGQKR
jgi:tRNA G18 (ribose-2'-O)-methylase SpoU